MLKPESRFIAKIFFQPGSPNLADSAQQNMIFSLGFCLPYVVLLFLLLTKILFLQ